MERPLSYINLSNEVISKNHEDKFFQKKYCNFIDGIRVDLDVGWFLIRASNTENSLVLRIDGNTKENFVNLSKEVDALLKSEKIIVNDISQV